jgi:quinol monooxygenase YgiN
MLLITGTFRLPPERLVEARPIMERMIKASREEPGCIDYSYAEDILDAGLVRVMEVWRDRPSLQAHLASQHIAHWRSAWPALGIGERQLLLYEADEPSPT